MALTRTIVPDSMDIWGKTRVQAEDIVLDTSYPTGGYSLPASALGWSQINGAVKLGGNSAAGGYSVHYDTVNKKLMVFRSAGFTPAGTVAAPVFTGSALAGHSHTIPVTAGTAGDAVTNNAGVLESTGGQDLTTSSDSAGTPAGTNSAPAFTGTAVAAAAMTEVANGVNLSTVTLRVRFEGI